MCPDVLIRDVAPRDGLQNEQLAHVSTAQKQQLVDDLVAAGLSSVELTSFVKPEAVPMMADADALMRQVRAAYPTLQTLGLIFNESGYQRALSAGAQHLALVYIASEALSIANTRRTPEHWLAEYRTLIPRILAGGAWLRVYVAAAWVCPYEGQVSPQRTLAAVEAFLALGAHEICLTDVAGLAQPQQVGSLCAEIAARWGAGRFAVHLHDTQALGLANAFAAFQAGIRTFDTSLGGLGGCPFAPGSAGNLATEDLVLMLHQMGCSTGIDIDALWRAVHRFEPVLGRRLGGRTRSWYDSQQEKETT